MHRTRRRRAEVLWRKRKLHHRRRKKLEWRRTSSKTCVDRDIQKYARGEQSEASGQANGGGEASAYENGRDDVEQTRAELQEVFNGYKRSLQLTQNQAGAARASTARTTDGTTAGIVGTSAVIDVIVAVIQSLAHNRHELPVEEEADLVQMKQAASHPAGS